MNSEKIFEYLQIYGSDISTWPEDLIGNAKELYERSSTVQEMVRRERDFESILLERKVEEPSSDLERRITLSATPRHFIEENKTLFSEIFGLFIFPKPALTIALVLLFGFTLGYLYDSYAEPENNELSDYIHLEEGNYYEP